MKSSKTDKKKQIYSMTRFDIILGYFDVRFFLIAMSLKYDKFIGTFKIIKNKFQKIPMRDQKQRQVSRQAYAGLLWSKQFYYYVIEEWLKGDSNQPPPPASRLKGRNFEWLHLFNMDIISMPDKWEYPWVIV